MQRGGRNVVAVVAAIVVAGCGGATLIGGSAPAPSAAGSAAAPETSPTAKSTATARPTPATIGTVTIDGDECALALTSGPIAPGLATITAVNHGNSVAFLDMWLIGGGQTYADFAEHIDKEVALTFANKPFLGPPAYAIGPIRSGELPAGATGQVTGPLIEGAYGIVCVRDFERTVDDFRVFAYVGPIEVGG